MDVPMREPKSLPVGAGLVGPGTARRVKSARLKLWQKASQVKLAWRLTLGAILFCSAAIIWLGQTSTIVSLGYDIENMDKQEALLNRQAEAMNTELASYTNLKQIEKEAREKLGMTDATKFLYLPVPDAPESARDGSNTNPRLYQVTDWWRIVSQMLPAPWRDAIPARPK